MKRHVIIGNSGAAINAAKAIRSVSADDEITLVSREIGPAYSPVLITHYLSGHIPYEGLFFVDADFYRRNRLQLVSGRSATRVDAARHVVELDDGASIPYDDLLVATGSRSAVPRVPGVQGEGVLTLWTAEDARRMNDWAERVNDVIVAGAGLIGLQVLEAMAQRGKRITLIELVDRVMPLALDAGASALVKRRLEEAGVNLHLGDAVGRIDDDGGRKVVTLASGQQVAGDLVVMATGVRPNVDLAESAGLTVSRGIVVDEFTRTNVADIYAAGDVAEAPEMISGKTLINATWFNAAEQGMVAGLNMAGVETPYLRNARMNVSSIMGVTFASAGLTDRANEGQDERCLESNGCHRKLIFDGERLVGAVLVGDVEEIGVLAGLLRRPDQPLRLRASLDKSDGFAAVARMVAMGLGVRRLG